MSNGDDRVVVGINDRIELSKRDGNMQRETRDDSSDDPYLVTYVIPTRLSPTIYVTDSDSQE